MHDKNLHVPTLDVLGSLICFIAHTVYIYIEREREQSKQTVFVQTTLSQNSNFFTACATKHFKDHKKTEPCSSFVLKYILSHLQPLVFELHLAWLHLHGSYQGTLGDMEE